MHNRNLLDIRRAAYTVEDWHRREEIFERVLSGQPLRKIDLTWLEKQGLRRWERDGKRIL